MSGVTITNMTSAGVGVKDVRPYFSSEIIFMFCFLKGIYDNNIIDIKNP